MKKTMRVLALLCLVTLMPLLLNAQGTSPSIHHGDNPEYQAGKLYVKVKNSSSFELLGYPAAPPVTDPELLTIMHRYGVSKVEKPFAAFRTDYFDRTYRFTFDDNEHVENLIADLSSVSYIEFAEKVPAIYGQVVSNDPIQPYHLGLLNANGASNIHISTGTTVVAIVDDAVMTTHEDLAGAIGPLNRDVADLDNNPNPPFTGIAAAIGGHQFSHGTHVAGIAGAVTNNATGLASIGWNNTLMCVKVKADNDASGSLPFAYDGVTWAATNGAQVINMSWGGTAFSAVEYNIILTARNMNIVMVAAAGNNYMINPFYPAAYGEGTTGQVWEILDRTTVIAVAGLDSNNDLSYWGVGGFGGQSGSNYGQWVDISAYGTNIMSSVANSSGGIPINNQYLTYDGTSMAAPQVSGIAGIMRSLNTGATANDVYNCLVYTANPDIYNTMLHPANLPGMLGSGRADAEAALKCIDVSCLHPIAVIVPSAMTLCAGDSITLTANTGTAYAWSTGATTQSTTVTTAGTYSVTVTFAGGCTASTSVTISNADTQAHIVVSESSGLAPNDGILCGLDMLQLSSYSGLTYHWSAFGATTPAIPGTINAGLSLPFPWTVCVIIGGVGGCAGVVDTACVNILWRLPPTVSVTPASATICAGQSTVLTASGADTYTWLPATGLSCTSCANPTASPGSTTTYTVTGVDTAGCSSTATVTVTVNPLPVLSFTPAGTVCSGTPPFTLTATPAGGTFSGPNVSGSTFTPPVVAVPTGYIVTYTYTDPNGCTADTSQLITVNPATVVTFSYAGSPYCQNAANPFPTVSGGTPGLFSSTAGLVFVSTTTGQINLAASTPGTYTVSTSGGCPVTVSTATVTITAVPVGTFSYTASPYCKTAANPLPVFSGGGVAGTFSSTAGLVFANTSTGEVNLSASTAGTYTVTNTIAASGGCPAVTATSTITITAPTAGTFLYASSPYCQNASNPSPSFIGGGVAGTFSSTAGLVFISTATGQINLAASTPGTYIVTNTIAASGGCPVSYAVSNITITAPSTGAFLYAGSPYCKTAANPSPTFIGGGVAGTFSSTAGLVFVSTATGQINLSASTPGTYTVTNTIPASGGCPAVISTSNITITAPAIGTFLYASSPYCQNAANPFPTFIGGGVAGTFSSTTGLAFVSTATGQINLAASTPGTYTVTNTIPASGGCPAVINVSNVTITAPSTGAFLYAGSPYCNNAANPSPTFIGGGIAGTFSSTAGLVFVSTSTGQINLAASTPGTYTVTNTIAASGGCPAVISTSNITITAPAVGTFFYTGNPYCQNASNPLPTFVGSGVAGTFSSTTGLVFVSTSTGQINLAASTPGTYTVINTIAASGGCPASYHASNITIKPLPTVSFGALANVCSGGPAVTLTTGSPAGGTYGGLYVSGGVFTPPTVVTPTSYLLSYTYTDPTTGCSNTAYTTITVTVCPPACGTCPNTLDALATGGVLSTTPPGGVVYCLNNNLTINGAVAFTLCEVRIAPGVTITVNPGASLNILASHLYSCTDMWQGIVVKPGGTVAVQSLVIGTLINRSPLIEDARVAIDVQSGSTVTSNLVVINNATFNRNEVGLRVTNYTPALSSYPFSIVNSVFTSRDLAFTPGSLAWPHTNSVKATYTVSNPLQTPYINDATYPDNTTSAYLKAPFTPGVSKPAYHIQLIRVGQTVNPATTPVYYEMMIGTTGAANYNIFDNMQFGIDGTDANFTSVNNIFQRTIGAQKGNTAINVVARETTNCRLQVIPASSTSFVNKFYDCGRSIVATNYFEVNAKYCEVRSLQNFALHYNTPHRGQNGFIINTNRYIAINLSNNMMANIENAIAFQANIGYYAVGPWTSSSGQYSGKVDINSNTIQAYMPGFPLAGSYVNKAITANNITGFVHFVNSTDAVNTNSNILTEVQNGIRATNWQKKSVLSNNNTITMVAVPGSPTTQYGISHANNIPLNPMSNNVKSNSVQGFGITNPNIVAIATQLCNNQVVSCNTTKNITMGIYFSGNEVPTTFSNNTFDNAGTNRHKYAYVLDNNGIIGQQGNGPGTSSSPQTPSDNRWTGTWTSGVNFKTATLNGSIALNSKLWVRNSAAYLPSGAGFNTSNPVNPAFEYNAAGAVNITVYPTLALGCPISICIPCITASMVEVMEQMTSDRMTYPVNSTATKQIAKNQLYRTLRLDPSYMATSGILQTFYTNSQNSNRENFVAIEENFADGDFADARAKIDAAPGSSAIERNYKEFYTIYLNQQTDSLVDADSSVLYRLASGCPFTDGAVVFQARALYNAVYDINKDFFDECTYTSDRMTEADEEISNAFDAILYPNPAKDEVYIAPKGMDDQQIIVDVKDISGKSVYREQLLLSGGFSNFKLNINSGVYFVYITGTTSNETIVKKLVIQK